MPELEINLLKLKHNIKYIQQVCLSKHLKLVGIVKGCHLFYPVMEAFQQNGIDIFGISRTEVGSRFISNFHNPPILISLPSIRESRQVIQYFQASFNSEMDTIRSLSEHAYRLSKIHSIILMVDNGDLREGLMPDQVMSAVGQILDMKSPYIRLSGLGANMGCCSAVLPDAENILILQELTEDIEKRFGHPVKTVSVGGSVMLDWIENHELPSKINQIRIGEAILLGNIPTINKKHEKLYDDVLILKGTVLEVKEKPSYPTGNIGVDALGNRPRFINRGIHKRAILNFGIVDTDPEGLQPENPAIKIISANSDYTIVDVSDCSPKVRVGDVLAFRMNYRAMIQSFLSPFIQINFIGEMSQQ